MSYMTLQYKPYFMIVSFAVDQGAIAGIFSALVFEIDIGQTDKYN